MSFSQSRILVRPTNPYLPLSLTLKGGGRGGSARSSATITSHPRRPRVLSVARPSTDRQTSPAGCVAPIPLWNARRIKSSKTIGEGEFSHMRTCLYVICHLISHVLSRPTCFHTRLSSTRRGHARVHTLKDWCLHTCWLTKTCLCVTFNVPHRVFHFDLPGTMYNHTTLTYKIFSVCKFCHTKPCLRTLIWRIWRMWNAFTVNIRTFTKLFWHAETCLYTTFDTRVRVCVQFLT